jgi:hypothetical protein
MISRSRLKAGIKKSYKRLSKHLGWGEVAEWCEKKCVKRLHIGRKTSLTRRWRGEMDWKLGLRRDGSIHRDRKRIIEDRYV